MSSRFAVAAVAVIGLGLVLSRPALELARSWGTRVLTKWAQRLESITVEPMERVLKSLHRLECQVERSAKACEAVERRVHEVRYMIGMKCDELLGRVTTQGHLSREGMVQLLTQMESTVRELVRLQEVTCRESQRLGTQVDASVQDATEEVLMAVDDIIRGVRYGVRLIEARNSSASGSEQGAVSQSGARYRPYPQSTAVPRPPPPSSAVVWPPNPQSGETV